VIISIVYENDHNKLLKDVQHDQYSRSIGNIFKAARSELLRADAVIGSNLLIAKKVREVTAFDHRVLQDAHDIIAAAFRYHHDDGGQLRLFEDPERQRLRYLSSWTLWLDEQIQELVSYAQFVRSTVECVVFSNTEMGYMAENRLCDLLLTHFSAGDWMFQEGYLKIYAPARA
jgi:hypothetical protein